MPKSRDLEALTPIPKTKKSKSGAAVGPRPKQRGGARPGAGRPKGSKTRAKFEDMHILHVSNGHLPKDVLAFKMAYYFDMAKKFGKSRNEDKRRDAREALDKAADAAAILAPYVHARLQATAAFGDGAGKGVTPEAQKAQRDRIIDKFERMAAAVDKGLPGPEPDPGPVSQPEDAGVAGDETAAVPKRTH